MKLQDRNLSLDMQGDDVKLLHSELIQLGFEIPIEELESLIGPRPRPARFGPGTRQTVGQFQEAHGLEPNGIVDERTAEAINAAVDAQGSFLVHGQVRHTDGTPVPGLIVRAYDRNMRRKVLSLGQQVTNEEGHYEINYKAELFAQFGKSQADLFIKVFSEDDAELQESETRFGAQTIETVDFVIAAENYRGLSEYQQLIAKITPLLQDTRVADLQDSDMEYLAGRTGIDLQQITHLVASTKLGQQTGISAEVFYGGLRQNLPTTLPALLDQNTDVLHRALESAVAGNIIPTSMRAQVDEFIDRLPSLKADEVLKPALTGPASLGDLLNTVLPTQEKQQVVAEVFISHHGLTDDFWKELHQRPELTDEINQIQTTLQLGTLTGNHLPLVRELQEMAVKDSELNELRGFAKLQLEDWIAILGEPQENGQPIDLPLDVPGEDEATRIQNYATRLNQFVENTFPTNVIAQRLVKDDQADSPFKPVKAELKTFFDNNPTFEFGATPIDIYLSKDRGKKLKGVDLDKQEELTATLKGMQRVYKITPRFERISKLLADDLHSSQAIVSLGQRAFVEKHQETFGSEALAVTAYKQAEHVHLMALMLYAKHSDVFNSPAPYAIAGAATGTSQQRFGMTSVGERSLRMLTSPATISEPEWSTLFGSLDLCDCEHCKSVYSPAAYLVDILKFLKDGSKKSGKTPLEVLMKRRPDLEHIELTCENTDTPLPYVDLVNEVLEDALMPSPVEHWEFDESQGTTASDVSGNGNDGTLHGGPSWDTGKIGTSSLSFDGNDDYVQIGITEDLALTNTGSISVWIHPKGLGGATNSRGTIIAKENDYVVSWSFSANGGAIDWRFPNRLPKENWHAAGGYIAPINEWTHLVIVFDKGTVKTYANGELVDDVSGTGSIGLSGVQLTDITIGGRPGKAEYFYGLIDDLRLYDRALSADEVQASAVARTHPQTRGTAEELAANPEHINIAAYAKLQNTVYPWSLPLNLSMEEARVYLNHLGLQRYEVMETFFKGTPSDALINKDIAFEYLGLTAEETKLINGTTTGGPSATTVNPGPWDFWGLLETGNDIPDPTDGKAPHATGNWNVVLQRVSVFLRQSGLSYKELLELLGTYFINPIKIDGTRVITLVAIEKDNEGKDVDAATCDLSKLQINGLVEAILNKIHRFVRLSRKLGWPMRDLDKAITALKPADLNDDFLMQLSHIQRLRAALNLPVANVLSWWADIDTANYIDQKAEGQPEVKSLYERLFRNKGVINPLDATFTEDANALSGKISEHTPTLVAALGSSAADFTLLTTGTTAVVTDDKLDLKNLSRLYRVASFAKALNLSIPDFLSVMALTEIDPFEATASTLRFVEKVRVIRASGFNISELNYLLRHAYLESSGLSPSEQSIALILAEIRDGLRKIAAEYSFVPDPTGELTRKTLVTIKPALQWEDTDIEQAISLLEGTAVYTESLASTTPLTIALPSTPTDRISYDTTANELTWMGIMSEGEKALLLSFAGDEEYRKAVDQLFKGATVGQTSTVPLAALPQLAIPQSGSSRIVYDSQTEMLRFTGAMTLLEQALLIDLGADQTAIDALFLQPRSFVSDKIKNFIDSADITAFGLLLDQESSKEDKFDYVLTRLLAYGRISLGKSLVKQKLGEALKLDTALVGLLLETVLKSRTDANQPAMSDFLVLLDGGLSATYFDNQDLTGVTVERTDSTINFNWNSHSPDPAIAVGTFSVKWIGKVQPQHSESYTFYTNTDDGVRLWVDNQLVIDKWQDQPVTEHSATLVLKANQLYDIKMEYYQNGSHAVADLRWSSPSTPKAIISANHLFPNEAPVLTYQLLHKIARLVSAFKISDEELAYISAHSTDQDWLDITTLPLVETQSSALLFAAWERLVDLFHFRDSLPSSKIQIFSIFERAANSKTTKTELLTALSERTEWNLADLEFLDSAQGLSAASYKDEQALIRLHACFNLMKRLGASAKQVSDWGKTNQTASEELDNARSIKNAVKAKYDDKQWLVVAKPLKDLLREKQRAALVAYLVTHPDIAKGTYWRDASELYEYFLIDVEMDPCMMTTRIKQAISSVQLFVQRCLMNLEPAVSLNFEEAKEWREWRKQYRVWEANRKVFLYPENWIEPELRDDKSPFFKDLENELLQNDVTMDTAETAFLHYLEKLDEVARLEIVGMYHQSEKGSNNTEKEIDILHVFGRTFAIPHIYYYRKLEKSVWSAWEKVDLDIEGDHLIPVVWNRRLYLFWAIFTEQVLEGNFTDSTDRDKQTPVKKWEIQFAWSAYTNHKWSPKKVATERVYIAPNEYLLPTSTASTTSTPIHEGYSMYGPPARKQEILFKTLIRNSGELEIIVKNPEWSWKGLTYSSVRVDSKIRFQRLDMLEGGVMIPDESGFDPKSAEFMPNSTQIESMSFKEVEGLHELTLFVGEVDPTHEWVGFLKSGTSKYVPVLSRHAATQKQQNTFRILYPHQFWDFFAQAPFFYQDNRCTFFVKRPINAKPQINEKSNAISAVGTGTIYRTGPSFLFSTFYHPYVREFIKQLNRYGISGLLDPNPDGEAPTLRCQMISKESFFSDYDPQEPVVLPYPKDEVDFEYSGSYSLYNWELFFHAPLLIATRLSKNQRFDEAQKWFHYIFNPTSSQSGEAERFWKVKPFYEVPNGIQTLEKLMNEGKALDQQVEAWEENPFSPHVIARLRVVAYMKAVVMKYIDNLIAWGDQLFRRDTIESINEATQLYILAAQILGKRPEEIPARAIPETQTFSSLTSGQVQLNAFGNRMVEIEHYIFPSTFSNASGNTASIGTMPLFCISKNDKLLGYWSTVADRLFKIRHCMNIEGVVRQLPLFEPPIDPALLVRAAAAGVDIGSALSDINAALPHYRFNVMLQKAVELCNDVKVLGGALLSALEKRDAEALALLRSGHEIKLLDAIRHIKEQQIEEAKRTAEGLNKSRDVVNIRHEYYKEISFTNTWEDVNLSLMGASLISQAISTLLHVAGTGAHALPSGNAGASGVASPVVTVTYGGPNVGNSLESASQAMQGIAGILSTSASMSATLGGYWRRWDDWKLQEKLAEGELKQIDKQILAAEIRQAITEYELKNHDLQVENAKEVEAFLRDKYTNQELYEWMVGHISSIYFQSYQMAYDIAKRAERCFRQELGIFDSSFIQFGYWDSLKNGLLAGEKLHYDLKRMDVAYLDQNKREYEITKHVSLVLHDPIALVMLKETGQCEVELPEALFDADYPGHYMRRLKSLSLTIPCVVGPYTSVNCTLTLLSSKIRIDSKVNDADMYAAQLESQVIRNFGAIQSIATSSGQNDSGLFELNFRDERYLPFEGAGAVLRCRIDMPKDTNAIDFNTLSDVVLHLKYTAREGGEMLKKWAKKAMLEAIEENTALTRLFSLKHEFPTEWYRFLHPASNTDDNSIKLEISKDRFPFLFQGRSIIIGRALLLIKINSTFIETYTDSTFKLTLAAGDIAPTSANKKPNDLLKLVAWNGMLRAEKEFNQGPGNWALNAWLDMDNDDGPKHLDPNAIEEMLVVLRYSIK